MKPSAVESISRSPPGDQEYIPPAPGVSGWGCSVIRELGIPNLELLSEHRRNKTEYNLKHWSWRKYVISVAFDENDRVVGCYLYDFGDMRSAHMRSAQPNIFERILR